MNNFVTHILALLLMSNLLWGCTPAAEHTVCFFGSSVCRGEGAEQLYGYAAQVTDQLPKGWQTVNISVNGNNSYDLFARFDRDMTPTEARYVVLGISLGNEGLHELGGRALLSYRENMPRLIRMLQEQGRIVVVANNYSRADFNSTDYQDLCEVNLEVQQWDVPTINLFGTIDDGQGRWADGFWDGKDIYHPNDKGHHAMASAFPPSMWMALEQGKPLPQYLSTKDDNNGVSEVEFITEGQVSSYTLSYESNDTIFALIYSGTLQRAFHYINGEPAPENMSTKIWSYDDGRLQFNVRGNNLHQLLFYRAAMTSLEVKAIAEGKMLRSSLEIYCPLLQGDPTNLAQTMNVLTVKSKKLTK